jgi:hypothetical protein
LLAEKRIIIKYRGSIILSVKINNLYFAESEAEYNKSPSKYWGFVKKYPRKMEFYDFKGKPQAAINKYGVIISFNIVNGEKKYGYPTESTAKFLGQTEMFGHKKDLRRISQKVLEKKIDTRPMGGMIMAFPDDEYWYK